MLFFWLLMLLPQSDTFYELYDSGLKNLEAKNYAEAVTDFERAIEIRPESSDTAKTYGVQFTAYHPYHLLSQAYLGLKDQDKARQHLALAKQYREHLASDKTIAGKIEVLDFILNAENDPTTLETVSNQPSIAPVIKLLLLEDYEQALFETRELLNSFPNDPNLLGLKEVAEELILKQSELKKSADELAQAQQAMRDKIAEWNRIAVESERNGDLETALNHLVMIREFDSENRQAITGIRRLRLKLTEKGKSEAEIQRSYEQSQIAYGLLEEEMAAMEQNHQKLSQNHGKMLRDNQELMTKLVKYRNAENITSLDISADWSVKPSTGRKLMANVSAKVASNIALARTTLLLNDRELKDWVHRGGKVFATPTLFNVKLDGYDNEFKLRVEVMGQNEVKTFSYPYNIPRPTPLINETAKKIILFLLVFSLLLWFALKQMKRRKAFRERFNPYIAGAPVLNDHMFYGRGQLMKQILNTLHNNSLMIYGERRIGKTSFLHRLNTVLAVIDDPQYTFIPVLIDLQGVRDAEFFSVLDHEITLALENRGIALEPAANDLTARQFISRLRQYIKILKDTCAKKPKLVLLLDEVDVMNGFSDQTNQQLRSVFMKGFANHIVAVMAGIHINTQWKSEGSPWYNFFEQIELKPFSRSHGNALITTPVNGVYHYTNEAVNLIMKVTNGKPYLIQKICLNLVAHILAENRRKITEEDVQFVFKEIEHEFQGTTELQGAT